MRGSFSLTFAITSATLRSPSWESSARTAGAAARPRAARIRTVGAFARAIVGRASYSIKAAAATRVGVTAVTPGAGQALTQWPARDPDLRMVRAQAAATAGRTRRHGAPRSTRRRSEDRPMDEVVE